MLIEQNLNTSTEDMNGHVFHVQTRMSIYKLCQTLHTLGIHIISIHNYQIHHAKCVIIPILSKLYHQSHISVPPRKILQVTFGGFFLHFILEKNCDSTVR